MRATLLAIRDELKRRRHEPIRAQGQWLTRVVRGYFNYHAVPGNIIRLGGFRSVVRRLWRQALKRRSQRNRLQGYATEALPTSTYLDLEMHILTLRIASRHIPEAGAVCGSSAHTDLCGGRRVTAVPTAPHHR
jgi:hypothetical protein